MRSGKFEAALPRITAKGRKARRERQSFRPWRPLRSAVDSWRRVGSSASLGGLPDPLGHNGLAGEDAARALRQRPPVQPGDPARTDELVLRRIRGILQRVTQRHEPVAALPEATD